MLSFLSKALNSTLLLPDKKNYASMAGVKMSYAWKEMRS